NIWQTPISSTPDSKPGRYSGRGDVVIALVLAAIGGQALFKGKTAIAAHGGTSGRSIGDRAAQLRVPL
ncbi:hypothetical protein VDS28_16115, partial [Xanthomonas campestris pv. campestris]|nr:hypothetical protein [Xanthomonas campestris pv. campestris]